MISFILLIGSLFALLGLVPATPATFGLTDVNNDGVITADEFAQVECVLISEIQSFTRKHEASSANVLSLIEEARKLRELTEFHNSNEDRLENRLQKLRRQLQKFEQDLKAKWQLTDASHVKVWDAHQTTEMFRKLSDGGGDEGSDDASEWVLEHDNMYCFGGKQLTTSLAGFDGGARDAAKCGSLAANDNDCNPLYVHVRKVPPFNDCFCATADNMCVIQGNDDAFAVFRKQTTLSPTELPTSAPTAVPIPAPTDDAMYALGKQGTHTCDNGRVSIATIEECEMALTALGIYIVKVWDGYPCYKDAQGNGYANGQHHTGAYFICKKIACPAGYIFVDGDIPGGDAFGRGYNNRKDTIEECRHDCDGRGNCLSFEYSHSEHQCYLNLQSQPSTSRYLDYLFCSKASQDRAIERRGVGGCGGSPYLREMTGSFDQCSTACVNNVACIKFQRHGNTCWLSDASSKVQQNEPTGNPDWECGFIVQVECSIASDCNSGMCGSDGYCKVPCTTSSDCSSAGYSTHVCDNGVCKATCRTYKCTTRGWDTKEGMDRATDPTESKCCETKYKSADRNTEYCPSGFSKLHSSAECRAACKSLGWENDDHGDRFSQSQYPSGCIENGLHCYWNGVSSGMANPSRSPVCINVGTSVPTAVPTSTSPTTAPFVNVDVVDADVFTEPTLTSTTPPNRYESMDCTWCCGTGEKNPYGRNCAGCPECQNNTANAANGTPQKIHATPDTALPHAENEDSGLFIAMTAVASAFAIVSAFVSCFVICYVRTYRRRRSISNAIDDTGNSLVNSNVTLNSGSASQPKEEQPIQKRVSHDLGTPIGKPSTPSAPSSSPRAKSLESIRIIFSHSSRNKSLVATDIVETMISEFVSLGIPRQQMMYQYSMDIPPNRHWADVWMSGLIEAEIVIIIMEQVYLNSEACVQEFLCSQDKDQAIVACSMEELQRCRATDPRTGATGCGQVIMHLKTGKQLYLNGAVAAARDIEQRLRRGCCKSEKSADMKSDKSERDETTDPIISTKVSL